jgi:hypothetical protein
MLFLFVLFNIYFCLFASFSCMKWGREKEERESEGRARETRRNWAEFVVGRVGSGPSSFLGRVRFGPSSFLGRVRFGPSSSGPSSCWADLTRERSIIVLSIYI